jgi:uncharacterized protein
MIARAGVLIIEMIDYKAIWCEARGKFNRRELSSIHGPEHWDTVEAVGLKIAHLMEAMNQQVHRDVVRLFAVLHDSCRESDGSDPEHGRRAAEYAKELRGRLFDLSDQQFSLLIQALTYHADGFTSGDLTIGACWDADRMDLWRVGIKVDPAYISIPAMRRRIPHL